MDRFRKDSTERGAQFLDGKQAKVYTADPLSKLMSEETPMPTWLVEDYLEDDTLGVIVGPEGSFKSFIAIDLAMCISHGGSYHRHRTVLRPVLYIAGEGRAGVFRRIRGWLQYHGIDASDKFYLGRGGIELMSGASVGTVCEWVTALMEKTGERPVIIIDTVSRNFGAGDESRTESMSQVVANIDKALRASGATVILVHHSPIESNNGGKLRTRGSNVLPAAADCILGVTYDQQSEIVELTPTKMKDSNAAEPLRFKRRIEDLGQHDNFGNPVTTVVLIDTDEKPAPKPARDTMGRNQKLAMDLLIGAGGSMEAPLLRKKLGQAGVARANTYGVYQKLEELGRITNDCAVLRVVSHS